ncbi:MAG: hypothetical protein KF751_15575, partial [Nitrospira sp.]|nr:hypothetical protein [Nitrospira sp.]
CQILSIKNTQDVLMKIKKNVVEMTGCVNLCGNALQMFCVIDLVLEVLDIRHHRCRVHPTELVENRT